MRSDKHLGRGDRGVFLLRKIWQRELRNLAEGRPVKRWTYRPDRVPTYPKARLKVALGTTGNSSG